MSYKPGVEFCVGQEFSNKGALNGGLVLLLATPLKKINILWYLSLDFTPSSSSVVENQFGILGSSEVRKRVIHFISLQLCRTKVLMIAHVLATPFN